MAEKRVSINFYIESSILGIIRSIIGLPFEHPFEVIKTKAQSEKNLKSSFQVHF